MEQTLEEKTLAYWCLTSFPITAGDAIATSNVLLSKLNPTRHLALLVDAYLQRVIIGGRRKKSVPKPNNVIELKRNTL